jgi:hypothetical protein
MLYTAVTDVYAAISRQNAQLQRRGVKRKRKGREGLVISQLSKLVWPEQLALLFRYKNNF